MTSLHLLALTTSLAVVGCADLETGSSPAPASPAPASPAPASPAPAPAATSHPQYFRWTQIISKSPAEIESIFGPATVPREWAPIYKAGSFNLEPRISINGGKKIISGYKIFKGDRNNSSPLSDYEVSLFLKSEFPELQSTPPRDEDFSYKGEVYDWTYSTYSNQLDINCRNRILQSGREQWGLE